MTVENDKVQRGIRDRIFNRPPKPPVSEVIDGYKSILRYQIEVRGPEVHQNLSEQGNPRKLSRREKREAKKRDKSSFPQTREIEDAHQIMDKRPAPNEVVPFPQQTFVLEEISDARRLDPPPNKWGPFKNESREEYIERLRREGKIHDGFVKSQQMKP